MPARPSASRDVSLCPQVYKDGRKQKYKASHSQHIKLCQSAYPGRMHWQEGEDQSKDWICLRSKANGEPFHAERMKARLNMHAHQQDLKGISVQGAESETFRATRSVSDAAA